MSQERSGDDISVTAEALIQVAEAEVRAVGGRPVSPETRDTLTHALTRDLNVASDQARVVEERIAKIETQTQVLADAVIAIAATAPSVAVAPAVEAVKAEMSGQVVSALPHTTTTIAALKPRAG
jgi:hypothetical protein